MYQRLAELAEAKLYDQPKAFHWWSEALVEDPRWDHAIEEAERLAGATGAWDEMVAAYTRAIEEGGDPTGSAGGAGAPPPGDRPGEGSGRKAPPPARHGRGYQNQNRGSGPPPWDRPGEGSRRQAHHAAAHGAGLRDRDRRSGARGGDPPARARDRAQGRRRARRARPAVPRRRDVRRPRRDPAPPDRGRGRS